MDKKTILNNIKFNSKFGLNNLSENELESLLKATVETIDSTLEKNESVEVNDFGVFSRRKHGNISVSFFKPAERLNDRISRKR